MEKILFSCLCLILARSSIRADVGVMPPSFLLDIPYPSHFLHSLNMLNMSLPFLTNATAAGDPGGIVDPQVEELLSRSPTPTRTPKLLAQASELQLERPSRTRIKPQRRRKPAVRQLRLVKRESGSSNVNKTSRLSSYRSELKRRRSNNSSSPVLTEAARLKQQQRFLNRPKPTPAYGIYEARLKERQRTKELLAKRRNATVKATSPKSAKSDAELSVPTNAGPLQSSLLLSHTPLSDDPDLEPDLPTLNFPLPSTGPRPVSLPDGASAHLSAHYLIQPPIERQTPVEVTSFNQSNLINKNSTSLRTDAGSDPLENPPPLSIDELLKKFAGSHQVSPIKVPNPSFEPINVSLPQLEISNKPMEKFIPSEGTVLEVENTETPSDFSKKTNNFIPVQDNLMALESSNGSKGSVLPATSPANGKLLKKFTPSDSVPSEPSLSHQPGLFSIGSIEAPKDRKISLEIGPGPPLSINEFVEKFSPSTLVSSGPTLSDQSSEFSFTAVGAPTDTKQTVKSNEFLPVQGKFPTFEIGNGSSSLPPPLPIEELLKKFSVPAPVSGVLPPLLESNSSLSSKIAQNSEESSDLSNKSQALFPIPDKFPTFEIGNESERTVSLPPTLPIEELLKKFSAPAPAVIESPIGIEQQSEKSLGANQNSGESSSIEGKFPTFEIGNGSERPVSLPPPLPIEELLKKFSVPTLLFNEATPGHQSASVSATESPVEATGPSPLAETNVNPAGVSKENQASTPEPPALTEFRQQIPPPTSATEPTRSSDADGPVNFSGTQSEAPAVSSVGRGPLDVSSFDSPLPSFAAGGFENRVNGFQQPSLGRFDFGGPSGGGFGNQQLSLNDNAALGNPYLFTGLPYNNPSGSGHLGGGNQFGFNGAGGEPLHGHLGPPVGGFNSIAQGLALLSSFGDGGGSNGGQFFQKPHYSTFDSPSPSFNGGPFDFSGLQGSNNFDFGQPSLQQAPFQQQQQQQFQPHQFTQQGFPQAGLAQSSFHAVPQSFSAGQQQQPLKPQVSGPVPSTSASSGGINPAQFGTLASPSPSAVPAAPVAEGATLPTALSESAGVPKTSSSTLVEVVAASSAVNRIALEAPPLMADRGLDRSAFKSGRRSPTRKGLRAGYYW